MNEITVNDKQALVEAFNNAPAGGFISIVGYESATGEGEKANYVLQLGVNYENIVKLSIEKLKNIIEGKDIKSVHVKCQTWKNLDGTFTNRKAKDRTLVTYEQDYDWNSFPFQDACKTILNGLENPKKVETPFAKEATGLYSIDGDALYIRECLVINKQVVQYGTRPVSATEPFIALKNEIKEQLPVGNYRTFKLSGKWEKVVINHSEIVSE